MLILGSGLVGSAVNRLFRGSSFLTREDLYRENSPILCEKLVIAAPSAGKWKANQEAEKDKRQVDMLLDALSLRLKARSVTLFGTIDFYGSSNMGGESHPPSPDTPYGANRLYFANSLAEMFDEVQVVRLPGLFGHGLKKNLLFDLKHHRWDQLGKVSPKSRFQWADIDWAVATSFTLLSDGMQVLNLAVEPLYVSDLPGWRSWQQHLSLSAPIINHHMTTESSVSGYLLKAEQVKSSIRTWLNERESGST